MKIIRMSKMTRKSTKLSIYVYKFIYTYSIIHNKFCILIQSMNPINCPFIYPSLNLTNSVFEARYYSAYLLQIHL